jgi:hypothetical protein
MDFQTVGTVRDIPGDIFRVFDPAGFNAEDVTQFPPELTTDKTRLQNHDVASGLKAFISCRFDQFIFQREHFTPYDLPGSFPVLKVSTF